MNKVQFDSQAVDFRKRRSLIQTSAALLLLGSAAVPVPAQSAASAANGTSSTAAQASPTAGSGTPATAAGTAGTMAGTAGTMTGTAGTMTSPNASVSPSPNPNAAGADMSAPGTNAAVQGNSPATSGNGVAAPGTAAPNNTQATGPAAYSASGSIPASQSAATAQFDISQTITAALATSSEMVKAQRNVEIDRKRADEAAAAARPQLSAAGSATRFDAPTKIAFTPGTPPAEILHNHTETLAINLGDRFDITGQIRAAADQYRLQSLADQFAFTQARNARILRAKTIYFNLLRAQHQVQVAQANLSTAQAQQQNAQKLYQGQVGQKIDYLRANTQVAIAQQALTSAVNNLHLAAVNFNDLTGRPLNSPVTVTDVPGATVGVDITNGAAGDVGAPTAAASFTAAPADIAGANVDTSVQTGLANRPEVLADEVAVRVAETGVKLARAGLEPSFSIDAAGDYYPTTSFQTPRQRVASLTASLTIPLYDGGATRDRIAEAHLRTENAQTTLDSTREDIALDVRQAVLNLQTAAAQIDAANTALQQAVAARQLAQVRFTGGVGLYLEVTDAQSALFQAENSQVNAVYDYLIARAQYENAIGAPAFR